MLSAQETEWLIKEDTAPNFRKNETKAQYLWRLLRLTLKDTVKAVIATEKSVQKVIHGISHIRSISPNLAPNVGFIFDATLNPAARESILIDANCAYIVNWIGRLIKVVVFERPNSFQRILYCLCSEQYIAWKPGEENITLMDGGARVVHSTFADQQIFAAIYNSYRDELVLGHTGGTSTWQFRYNNQYLVQSRHAHFRSFHSETFQFLSLEATSSKTQRGFAASNHVVVIFRLENGQVLDYRKNLHLTDLTAILYFNPLKLLITAAKDGTIKAWNSDWTIRRVLVGHSGAINSLVFYPSGASFISCGADRTLRIWCLDTPGQLSCVQVENALLTCNTVRGEESFLSISSSGQVDLWKAHDLHLLQTCGGGPYLKLICTTQSYWPQRAIAMCADGCVRIIASNDGTLLSTALPPSLMQHGGSHHVHDLVDIAYTAFDDSLFAIYDNGEFVKFSMDTNPATLQFTIPAITVFEHFTSIVIYERICNPWPRPNEKALATDNLNVVGHLSLKVSQKLNRCMLFAGKKDGRICVIDWKTGAVQYSVDAHLSDGGVSCVATNEKSNILITSGHDQIIRIWKIYPFNMDPLSMMSSFFCAQLPKPICSMASNFSAALQHLPSATFALVTYDFDVNDRADHSPLDDHTDEIVGMSYCKKLGLLATAGSDGTIRIWDDFNRPIRILELNGLPHSVAFCGQNGDMLVGIGDNLHFLSHEAYLPLPYSVKLMTIRIRASPTEKPVASDQDALKSISKKALKLLSAASAASRYTRFDDPVPEDEQVILNLERDTRDKAYQLLADQDAEIVRVANGLEEPKKPRPVLKPADKKSAFDRYLDHFYSRPDTSGIDIDAPELNPKLGEDENGQEAKPMVPQYYPPAEPSTFFAKRRLVCPKPNWLIDPNAYIPNSVLAKLLFPPPPPDAEEKQWRPPGLSEEQLAFLRAHNNKTGRKIQYGDTERTLTFDYDDDTSYKQSLLDLVNAEPPPPSPPPPPPPQEEDKKPSLATKQSEFLSRKLQPQRQMKKFVRIVEPPKEPTPTLPTPPPAPSPIRFEEPELELPEYILQFIGKEWFDYYFPNPTPKTFPLLPPYSVRKFTDLMMKLLGQASFHMKAGILESFLVLYRQFGSESCNTEFVRRILLRMFDNENSPIDLNDKDHRQFVYACVNVLVTISALDTNVALDLMAFYMIGDDFTRELMLQEFCMAGMLDPKNYFGAEMDSWDPAGGKVDELSVTQQLRRRREFRKIAAEWLKRWTARFRRHLDRAVARLVRGQALIAAGKRPQGARGSNRRSTSLPSISSRLDGETQLQRTLDTLQVSIEMVPDVTKISISAIDTINYFCDQMAERDAAEAANAGDRNAVIAPVLPEAKLTKPVRLPRIGAMRYHDCNPVRESLCYADSHIAAMQPKRGPVVANASVDEDWDPLRFTANHLRLPTAVVNIEGPNSIELNPTPATASFSARPNMDKIRLMMEQNRSSFILLTLRSAPKYFYMPQPSSFHEEGIELA